MVKNNVSVTKIINTVTVNARNVVNVTQNINAVTNVTGNQVSVTKQNNTVTVNDVTRTSTVVQKQINVVTVGFIGPPGADGSDGSDGSDGASILSGSGVPDNGLGNDGDTYVDVDALSGDTYLKTSGVWNLNGNILGPGGADGADGADGDDGVEGSSAYNPVIVSTAQTIILIDADAGKSYIVTHPSGNVVFRFDAALGAGFQISVTKQTSSNIRMMSLDMTVNTVVNGDFTSLAESGTTFCQKNDSELTLSGNVRAT